jgi:hypothetical protein
VGAYNTPANKSENYYAVLMANGTALDLLRAPAANNVGELQAAAFFDGGIPINGKYYISLTGLGIFRAAAPAGLGGAAAILGSDTTGNFTALLPVGSELIAVTSKGTVWKIQSGGTVAAAKDYLVDFSGALALWDDGTNQVLLLGRKDISTTYYTNGYWELPVTGGVLDLSAGLAQPGIAEPTTVANNAKYNSSIGTHVINSFYQAPAGIDPARPLFASTQQDGLWSIRLATKEWNVE